MRNKKVLFIVQAALIAAIYVALTYLSSIAGLASGTIQVRISEALCILPVFTTAAIPGLWLGCFLANADRRYSGGCCVRKHCNFDWSVWNLCIKKA